jgi:hypothetical protein
MRSYAIVIRHSITVFSLVALGLTGFCGCSQSSPPQSGQQGTGGLTASGGASSASGGTTGSGGKPAGSGGGGAGGTMGSGGSVGTGGATGAGGTRATGGTTSAGGTLGSGGSAGTGGAVGTGGSSGSGGTVATGGAGDTWGSQGTGGARATGGSTARDGGPGSGGNTAGASGTGGSGTGGGGGSSDGGTTAAVPSAGCGKTPTLKNSPSSTTFTQNTLTISGTSRQYIIRWPDNYDNQHPYRLIIGLHGATGKGADIAGDYFGLWALSQGSTIFIAPSADGGLWSATTDTTFVSEILKTVEADLCIDTTRIVLEGFSQGAAMSWTLACSLPGVFRAAVGHSGGGVANPTKCDPIAYFGSLGLQENGGQTTQTDQFARWDGCTIETLPSAPTGGHLCSDYKGCSAGHPVRWCPYDGGHTPSPTDTGQRTSWMPSEVWPFVSQF